MVNCMFMCDMLYILYIIFLSCLSPGSSLLFNDCTLLMHVCVCVRAYCNSLDTYTNIICTVYSYSDSLLHFSTAHLKIVTSKSGNVTLNDSITTFSSIIMTQCNLEETFCGIWSISVTQFLSYHYIHMVANSNSVLKSKCLAKLVCVVFVLTLYEGSIVYAHHFDHLYLSSD